MSAPSFTVAPLTTQDREAFACGTAELDDYLKRQAKQDMKRRVAACYVMAYAETVIGYYTLSAAGVALPDLPPEIAKRLPRYPSVPAVLIGRLAVDQRYQGRGLGGSLLFSAVHRIETSGIGCHAVIVRAKDDPAATWYRRFGFVAYGSHPRNMLIPLKTLLAARP